MPRTGVRGQNREKARKSAVALPEKHHDKHPNWAMFLAFF